MFSLNKTSESIGSIEQRCLLVRMALSSDLQQPFCLPLILEFRKIFEYYNVNLDDEPSDDDTEADSDKVPRFDLCLV